MVQLRQGDPVQIDIPDEADPDYEKYHDRTGTVTSILIDDAPTETGDPRDGAIYRIKLSGGGTVDMRWRDLRPLSH